MPNKSRQPEQREVAQDRVLRLTEAISTVNAFTHWDNIHTLEDHHVEIALDKMCELMLQIARASRTLAVASRTRSAQSVSGRLAQR